MYIIHVQSISLYNHINLPRTRLSVHVESFLICSISCTSFSSVVDMVWLGASFCLQNSNNVKSSKIIHLSTPFPLYFLTSPLLMAAQDQALRTNGRCKDTLDNQNVSPACRMCRERVNAGCHLLALVQKQYKSWRHDKLKSARFALDLARNVRGLQTEVNWYGYKPDPVCDTEKCKLLWDFIIRSKNRPSHEHNKPNIVLSNKEEKPGIIINVACLFSTRIVSKEREKVDNYCGLKYEIKRFGTVVHLKSFQ